MSENSIRIFNENGVSHFTQEQKDALVELSIIVMYVDKTIAINENEIISALVEYLGWTFKDESEKMLRHRIHEVRNCKRIDDVSAAIFDSICKRLGSDEMRSAAIRLCEQIAESDGLAEKEKDFISKLKVKMNCQS
jgi:hypothetical protein